MVDDRRTGTWITYADGAAESLRIRRCSLTVIDGPDAGSAVVVESSWIRIGAEKGCDLVLSDRLVSRWHCEISLDAQGYRLRDLDSTNGTYVGGHRVRDLYLNPGTVLYLGDSRVRFEPLTDAATVPLSQRTHFGDMVATSPAMRALFSQLERIASTDASVLITGETGVGKELVAEAIHHSSERKDGPFVVVDCGAIPDNLIASELFGHEKGAFTGAVSTQLGAFERANGGTVFLDELGELPLDMQSHLLGAIERRQVRRVGGSRSIAVDIRVVAATNRDLQVEMNRGRFREDLYYRLAVVHVRVPSLRERPEDIPVLARHFIDLLDGDGQELSDRALEKLKMHAFPGNVRELRNLIERTVILAQAGLDGTLPEPGSATTSADESVLRFAVDEEVPYKVAKSQLVAVFDRIYVRQLLERHQGNLSQAARAARVDRMTIHKILQRGGIDRSGRRDDD